MKKHLSQATAYSTIDHILEITKLASLGFLLPAAADHIVCSYQNKNFEELFLFVGDLGLFPVFFLVRNELEDKSYFRFLGQVLTGECYASDFPNLIRALLSERSSQARLHLMEEEEQAFLEKQPSILTIYRGVSPQAINGFSWTLSLDKAKFFANRHLSCGRDAGIFQGSCKKTDVIAYFNREEEIFIDHKNIQNIAPIQLFSKICKPQLANPKYLAYLRIKEYLHSENLILPE